VIGGDDDLLVRARAVLLDALVALAEHRNSLVVIGAQAIYLQTGGALVAVAEATKDSDLAVDARVLRDHPLIDSAMERAGFILNPTTNQPGAWMSANGIPVDLMVPEAIAGAGGTRSVTLPPHSKRAFRRAAGLEAAVVDNNEMEIRSLAANDARAVTARVAGPAALLVAKLHKIAERQNTPGRLVDKDAHDIYRLLVAVPTDEIAAALERLLGDWLAGPVTSQAMTFLSELFAAGPSALGADMAGRAEAAVGEPETVAQAASLLSNDLLEAVKRRL